MALVTAKGLLQCLGVELCHVVVTDGWSQDLLGR